MRQRLWLLVSLLMVGAMVLAACAPAATEQPAEEPAAEEPAAEEPAAEEPAAPEDAIGFVEVAAGEPIHIAAMLTVSGATEFLGADSQGGIEIALDERGQIAGHDLLLTVEDSGCSAEGGQTAATRVAADPTIVGVIGTNCSSAMTAAISTISEAGLTILSPTNTAPALTDPEGTWQPGYFRTAHNDKFQGAVAAEFAYNEQGARTAATIHDGSPYADQLQQVFAARFEELGGTVTFQGAVNVGDTDMRPILTTIAADSPDVLYFPIFNPEGPFIAAQSSEIDGLEDTILFGADGLLSKDFAPAAGSAAEGMFLSGPYVSADIPAYAAFLETYEANTGGPPPAGFAAHAYDGTRILLDAIEKVVIENDDGSLLIGRQALRDAIAATSGYDGLTGKLTCDQYGDCATGEALGIFELTAAQVASEDNWPPPVVYTPGQGAIEAAVPAAPEFAGTIVLGAAVTETGKYAREGQDVRQGYNLWLDWVNNEYGGINVGGDRYQVEIVYYDDESDPDTAANLTERLITEDEVNFLLGPYSSGLTKATSAIAEKYGVVMVEGNGASESIFERGFENIFAVLTPAGNYTQSALAALADQGAKTVVIAYEDTAFPTAVAAGAQKWAEEYGYDILAVETYPKDVADVSAIMTKFRDLEPDVFVGGGHFNDALLFVAAAQELGFNPQGMVITVGPSNPDFAAEVGSAADYIIGPTQWAASMGWQGMYLGTPAEYDARYQAMWGESPTYQAAESTATALALQAAIESAGSLDMDAVRAALGSLDIVTFYGPISFDETGKNIAKPMAAGQIQDGTFVIVAPAEAAVADLQYPMPAWEDR